MGKTSVLNKVKEGIQSQGYVVGGFYCPEIIKNGKRTGFSIIDISTGEKGILASLDGEGPRVGRYRVNLKDLEQIGLKAIEKSLDKADFIFIDEIAPMELKSSKFRKAVKRAIEGEKQVIAVIHQKSRDQLVLDLKKGNNVMMFEVSLGNRNFLDQEIRRFIQKDKKKMKTEGVSIILKGHNRD
jgi:nucleoside-triphosphatase